MGRSWRRGTLLFVVGLGLTLVGWSWLEKRGASESGNDALAPETRSNRSHEVVEEVAEQPDAAVRRHPVAVPEPDPEQGPRWRVTDIGGQSLAGAEVSFGKVPGSFMKLANGVAAIRASQLPDVVATGSDGEFEVEPSSAPFVVWGSMSGYQAAPLLYRDDPEVLPQELVLEQSEPVTVTVVDESGRPARAAKVYQALAVDAADPRSADPVWLGSQRCFRRERNTRDDGQAVFGSVPGDGIYWAALGETVSSLETTSNSSVELTLRASFELEGKVECPLRPDLVSTAKVGVYAASDGTQVGLGSASIDEHGEIRPHRFPLLEGKAYTFILEAEQLLIKAQTVEASAMSELVRLHFVTEPAHAVTVAVFDQDANPISGADIAAWWPSADPHWAARASFGETLGDGRGLLTGIPAGRVLARAEAPGFLMKVLPEPLHVPLPEGSEIRLQLSRIARISGRVVHLEEPVKRFSIHYWTTDYSQPTNLPAVESADGRFDIEVPAGAVSIYAIAEDLGQSHIVTVDSRSSAEAEPEVVLQVPPPVRGVGRIVDGITGEPVSGATIQVYSCATTRLQATIGVPVTTGTDGRFELPVMSPDVTGLDINAPGYSRYTEAVHGRNEDPFEIGDLPLFALGILRIRITSDDPLAVAGSRVEVRGPMQGEHSVPANGVLEIPAASFGTYYLTLLLPDGTSIEQRHYFRSSPMYEAEFDLRYRRELLVEFAEGASIGVEDVTSFTMTSRPNGAISSRTRHGLPANAWDAQKVFHIPRAPRETFSLEIRTRNSRYDTIVVPAGDELQTRVVIGESGGSPIKVRVVDADRNPLPGCIVTLHVRHAPTMWRLAESTDQLGIAVFDGVGECEFLANLNHPLAGFRLDVPLRAGDGMEEIVLDPVAEIAIRLVEGSVPVSGVYCRVGAAGSHYKFDGGVSDSSGRLRWAGLSEGTYRIDVVHPGYWCEPIVLESTVSGEELRVQVRRTGSLRVDATGASGTVGARLRLQLDEAGVDVLAWMERGLLVSQSLVIDNSGSLTVLGIPTGNYRWSLHSNGTVVYSGQAEIGAGGETVIAVGH